MVCTNKHGDAIDRTLKNDGWWVKNDRWMIGNFNHHGISEKPAIWIHVFQSHGALSILDDLTCAKHGHIQWQCLYTYWIPGFKIWQGLGPQEMLKDTWHCWNDGNWIGAILPKRPDFSGDVCQAWRKQDLKFAFYDDDSECNQQRWGVILAGT